MLEFVVTCLLIELTPGPNMTTLAILASTKGLRAGFAAAAGVAAGLASVAALAALGLQSFVLQLPWLYEGLRWSGVALLLWMAWDGWRESARLHPAAATKSTHTSDIAPISLWSYAARGYLTNLLNPKAGLFFVALLPQFMSESEPTMPQFVTLTALYLLIASAIHVAIVAGAHKALTVLENATLERQIRRGLSLSLVGVALWFVWSTRAGA